MTVASLEEEIKAIENFIEVLQLKPKNDKHYILKSYIETESLSKTKAKINHILKDNGTKYQVNDIRDLIIKGSEQVDERVNDLAYRIYKANKKQTGRR